MDNEWRYSLRLHTPFIVPHYRQHWQEKAARFPTGKLSGDNINRSSGNAIYIFKSKDEYEKYSYMTRTLQIPNRPFPELMVQVDTDMNKMVGIVFPNTTTFPNSSKYLMAIYDLLAGGNKGSELKKKVESLLKDGISKEFTLNGRKYSFYFDGKLVDIRLYY